MTLPRRASRPVRTAAAPPDHRERGFAVHRIYEEGHGGGSYRVLVDRLWPRGISKEHAALDEWAKDVAPSAELRRWYGHDVEKFETFARRYDRELKRPPASDAVTHLRRLGEGQRVTLLTATRDVEHSGARVLHDLLRSHRP
jgi:uncharacterized protein YeaO (DUF488 family)